jgi:potassium-transporting ATPase potassium-binding subunit
VTLAAMGQLALYFALLLALAVPLGAYQARVFAGERTVLGRLLGPLERGVYRLSGVRPEEEMAWSRYAAAALIFNLVGGLVVLLILRLQGFFPSAPTAQGPVPAMGWAVAFNTAVSFATNTNWQSYGGETEVAIGTQMIAFTVQNFVSAATGMAVLVAVIRGFTRSANDGRARLSPHEGLGTLGNFWVDLTRAVLYVLLPLSLVLAVLLVSQGVVQTFSASVSVPWQDPLTTAATGVREQTLALGPAASQVAIKQLGTNGGGFFNVNSAHPFENPTALSNLFEALAILLIPTSLCFTLGAMVKDRRQGYALLAAMFVVFVPLLLLAVYAEQRGNPALVALGVDPTATALSAGGNMEGKEVRFGITQSALWATATSAASNGSVNAMHDSFTPLGGLMPMVLIQLGEIIFGGVGSGLYGLLVYALIAVFLAGLMVGRTPEFLGKKIEAFEIKMASLVLLLPALTVLAGTALACALPVGRAALGNPGAHGFSEILYAFSSAANNNGSAFAGLTANGTFYATALGVAMLVGRYGVIVPVLAIAGSLARKRSVPVTAGTLPTHTPLFVGLLVGTIVLVGALTFFPALALGPVAEHLTLQGR